MLTSSQHHLTKTNVRPFPYDHNTHTHKQARFLLASPKTQITWSSMPCMRFLASDAATSYLLVWFGVSGLSLRHLRANLNLGVRRFRGWVFPQNFRIVAIEIEENKTVKKSYLSWAQAGLVLQGWKREEEISGEKGISSTSNDYKYMDVSENSGTPKSSHSKIGFSIINHPFWGTPIVGNTHIISIFLDLHPLHQS